MCEGLMMPMTGLVGLGVIGRNSFKYESNGGTSADSPLPAPSIRSTVIPMPNNINDAYVVKDAHWLDFRVDLREETKLRVQTTGIGRVDVPEMPKDVRDFCALKHIDDAIKTTISLARKHFAIIGEPTFEVVDDPEYGEYYLGIHIDSEGRTEEVFQQNKAFLASFLASIDSQKRSFVNLIYHSTQE